MKSVVPYREKCDDCDRQVTFCFAERLSGNFCAFGSLEFVIKTSNQQTFLKNSREAEKENENNVGSRIVNLDSFMKEMDKCKSCHGVKIFHKQTRCRRIFI